MNIAWCGILAMRRNVWIAVGNFFGIVACILGILYDHGLGSELAYYLVCR
jgi:hypothetical protein